MTPIEKVVAFVLTCAILIVVCLVVIALVFEHIYTPIRQARDRAKWIAYEKELASSKIKPVHGNPYPYIFEVVQVEYRTDSASFDISHLYEQMIRNDFMRLEHGDIWSAEHWPHHGMIV